MDPVDEADQTLTDRYRLLHLIGSGGMSRVYAARHELLNKQVAVKVLKKDLATDRDAVTRFHREAMAAAGIGDPHIVDITDYGFTEQGEAFIVMEHLEGQSLREMIVAQSDCLELDRSLNITRQILLALCAAHARGIVHRDLKPDNVFVTPLDGEDFVKLLDFGISKIRRLPDENDDLTELTATGAFMGSPKYVAPEQVRNVSRVDHRADLYALGVMVYDMLTGSVPFTGKSMMDVLLKHVNEEPVPPRALRPDLGLPRELEAYCLKAMSKAPADRHQTAEEMLAALAEARTPASHPAVVADPGPGAGPPWRLVLGIGLVAGAAFAGYHLLGASGEPPTAATSKVRTSQAAAPAPPPAAPGKTTLQPDASGAASGPGPDSGAAKAAEERPTPPARPRVARRPRPAAAKKPRTKKVKKPVAAPPAKVPGKTPNKDKKTDYRFKEI